MAGNKDIGSLPSGRVRESGMLMALVANVALFTIVLNLSGKSFLVPANITNIFLLNGQIIILALGMLLGIVARPIDLLIGSVAAFTGAVRPICR